LRPRMVKSDHLEFTFRRSGRTYVLGSSDGKISIGDLRPEAVIEATARLVSKFVREGTSCRITIYASLGPGLRLLRDAGATCRVGLRDPEPAAVPVRQIWQMPGMPVPDPPPPVYASWLDYLQRTTRSECMDRCYAASKKANRKRLLSDVPSKRLSGPGVWAIIDAAQGRCAYCASLAVESRPSGPNGAPMAWAQVGRRIGSLEHVRWRYGGGGNDLSNLAWVCLWCNTWPSERRHHALDHGGFYPSA